MSDAQLQAILQRTTGRIGGDHLEILGKKAAALWAEGRAETLSDAVTSVVKTAGLSSEQVKRVIEFTNTAAFLGEFRKEGAGHKVVDFGAGGPASPSTILKDLNDGGSPAYSKHASDYSQPPVMVEKTASAWDDQAVKSMFNVDGPTEFPEVNPLGDVIELREKLGSAYQQTTAMLTDLEAAYVDLQDRMFHEVKQAALSGHALSEIVTIWSQRAPSSDHVKVAFGGLMDQLVENGVFADHDALISSLEKYASVGMVNDQHPLVGCFVEYCDVLSKLAEVRSAQQELGEGFAQLTHFLKHSSQAFPSPSPLWKGEGVIGKAKNLIDHVSQHAGRGGHAVGEVLFGQGSEGARHLGNAAHIATKYVAPALAVNEGYRRFLKHDPVFQQLSQGALGTIPGTQEYRQKELEYELLNQGYPPGASGGFP